LREVYDLPIRVLGADLDDNPPVPADLPEEDPRGHRNEEAAYSDLHSTEEVDDAAAEDADDGVRHTWDADTAGTSHRGACTVKDSREGRNLDRGRLHSLEEEAEVDKDGLHQAEEVEGMVDDSNQVVVVPAEVPEEGLSAVKVLVTAPERAAVEGVEARPEDLQVRRHAVRHPLP